MTYDVLINNKMYKGLSYATLIALPIGPTTLVRRANSQWIIASECVELSHVINRALPPESVSPNISLSESQRNPMGMDGNRAQEIDTSGASLLQTPVEEPNDVHPVTANYTPAAFSSNDNDSREYSSDQPDYEDEAYDYEQTEYEEDLEPMPFVPTMDYLEYKRKRKKAIIGIFTLGLAAMFMFGVGRTWRSNIFAGTSFMRHEGIAFVLKGLSFFLLTALMAIPYFIYSIFAFFYYSIKMNVIRQQQLQRTYS